MTDPNYEGEVELMLALGTKKYAENTRIIWVWLPILKGIKEKSQLPN